MTPEVDVLVADVANTLRQQGKTLITAESCTGGLIASHLTSVPGSSEWFEGAFVTYRLSAKVAMLGVKQESLDRFTAVSDPVAREMAIGALRNSDADVSVSVTGVAGPGGGDIATPVGTVWFGWAIRTSTIDCVQTSEFNLDGDRDQVREQAVHIALAGVLRAIR